MIKITKVLPQAGVEGGKIKVECTSFPVADYDKVQLRIGGVPAHLSVITSKFLVAEIPPNTPSGPVTIAFQGSESNGTHFEVGRRLATDLHAVGNPALDIDGNILVTFSGSRGQKVPVTVFKLDAEGNLQPFISDIINPTGIARDAEGNIFISSRHDGNVYKATRKGEVTIFTQGLGTATGLAFDKEGNLYVGDRNGTIFKVDRSGVARSFATIPASVAAFHMAFGPDGNLYVTNPTLSTRDSVFRITPDGRVTTFFTGLNRPQGLAFDENGNLFVVAYLGGDGGVVKITLDGRASLAIAGANLVGLAFDNQGNLILTSHNSVYKLALGIKGLPLI